MKSWIDEIAPHGDILEIGFGSASTYIQSFRPNSHTVINLDEEAARRLSSEHPAICTIKNCWQDALPRLGMFDLILYHGNTDMHLAQEGMNILSIGKEVFQKIQESFPQLSTIRYSDQDLDQFYQQVDQIQRPSLPKFFSELLRNGQMSELQYQNIVSKYQLPLVESKSMMIDHLFEAIQESRKHLRKNGRFSCLIGDSSRYEDPQFFEHLIANPFLDYKEKTADQSTFLILESFEEESLHA